MSAWKASGVQICQSPIRPTRLGHVALSASALQRARSLRAGGHSSASQRCEVYPGTFPEDSALAFSTLGMRREKQSIVAQIVKPVTLKFLAMSLDLLLKAGRRRRIRFTRKPSHG